MTEILKIGSLFSDLMIQLIIMLFYFRIMMRLLNAGFDIPLVQTVAKLSNPLCYPLAKILNFNSRFDATALITIILIIFGYQVFFAAIVHQIEFSIFKFLISSILIVISKFLGISFWLVIIAAIASWIGRIDNSNAAIVVAIGQYICDPIRRLMPNLGGIDLSPIIVIFLIQIIQNSIIPQLTSILINVQ